MALFFRKSSESLFSKSRLFGFIGRTLQTIAAAARVVPVVGNVVAVTLIKASDKCMGRSTNREILISDTLSACARDSKMSDKIESMNAHLNDTMVILKQQFPMFAEFIQDRKLQHRAGIVNSATILSKILIEIEKNGKVPEEDHPALAAEIFAEVVGIKSIKSKFGKDGAPDEHLQILQLSNLEPNKKTKLPAQAISNINNDTLSIIISNKATEKYGSIQAAETQETFPEPDKKRASKSGPINEAASLIQKQKTTPNTQIIPGKNMSTPEAPAPSPGTQQRGGCAAPAA